MSGMYRDRVRGPKKRRLSFQRKVQLAAAALFNGYAAGFQKGKIFTVGSKALCVPVLNWGPAPSARCKRPWGPTTTSPSMCWGR